MACRAGAGRCDAFVARARRQEKAACSDARIQPHQRKAYWIQYWLAPMAQFLKIGQVQPDSISKLATLNTKSAMRILRGEGVFNVFPWSSEIEHG